MRPGLTTLRSVPVFAPLDDGLLIQINAMSEVQIAAHGDRLCEQGMQPDILYFVLDGQVALSSTAPDGSIAVVEVLQAGQDFVLASVMSELPYVQSAACRAACAASGDPVRPAAFDGGARTGIGIGAAALPVGRFP